MIRKLLEKQCKTCSKIFYTRCNTSKYCCKDCRPNYEYNRKQYTKFCILCGNEFTTKDNKIKYCTLSCATKSSFEKRKSSMVRLIPKKCEYCGIETMLYPNQRYCCVQCKHKSKYTNKDKETEYQYKNISGNWKQYFLRLVHQHKRMEDGLTRDYLLELLSKQNGKCALTGVELTCKLEKGVKCKTNASIDRINAGEKYTPENVQLVCRAVNSFRTDLPVEEFVEWCKKVVDYNNTKNLNE